MEANQTTELLASYKAEMQQELSNILGYWSMYAVDEINGGFHGRINNDNEADPAAPTHGYPVRLAAVALSVLYPAFGWSVSARWRPGQ